MNFGFELRFFWAYEMIISRICESTLTEKVIYSITLRQQDCPFLRAESRDVMVKAQPKGRRGQSRQCPPSQIFAHALGN